MNRLEAQQTRSKMYDDEGGCRNGHVPTRRYTSTGNCVACAKERFGLPFYRVKLKPNQVQVFEALATQMGWEYSSKKHPLAPEPDDTTGKIPYV